MIGGVRVAADEAQNLLVVVHADTGGVFLAAVGIHGLCLDDAAHHAKAVDHGTLVDRIGRKLKRIAG